MTFPPEVWDGVLHRLSAEIPAFAVDSWLSKLVPELREAELRLLAPNTFHRNRVRETFLPRIRAVVRELLGDGSRVSVEVGGTPAEREAAEAHARKVCGPQPIAPSEPSSAAERATAFEASSSLTGPELELRAPEPHPERMRRSHRTAKKDAPSFDQNFDSFIVGPANALAREAALAIATQRHASFRSLYLFSDSGMGKTHLARAVYTEASKRERVRYVTAEGFTNAFMAAVRTKLMPAFKQKFREHCELLVIEDVQFLGGKPGTQLELFHTIAHLIDSGARVVVTGDRPPQELAAAGIDTQLSDQLSSSFVAPLGAPDTQLRRDILRAKASAGGVGLDDQSLGLLVEVLGGSVRHLDAVLTQLVTTSTLLKRPIDLTLVREVLATKGAIAAADAPRPTPALVIGVVAQFFKTTPEALSGRSRRRDILVPRQLAMYLCRRFTNASLAEIGRELGREHPAVRNAVKQVEKRVTERAPARYQLEAVSERVRAELEGRSARAESDAMTPARTDRPRQARSVIPIRDAAARRA